VIENDKFGRILFQEIHSCLAIHNFLCICESVTRIKIGIIREIRELSLECIEESSAEKIETYQNADDDFLYLSHTYK